MILALVTVLQAIGLQLSIIWDTVGNRTKNR
jgi:hypothetical protein